LGDYGGYSSPTFQDSKLITKENTWSSIHSNDCVRGPSQGNSLELSQVIGFVGKVGFRGFELELLDHSKGEKVVFQYDAMSVYDAMSNRLCVDEKRTELKDGKGILCLENYLSNVVFSSIVKCLSIIFEVWVLWG
jgi:hypothetical protein